MRQLSKVSYLMADGGWRTLREISVRLGKLPETSVSARLRELRQYGFTVSRRKAAIKEARVFEYRVSAP